MIKAFFIAMTTFVGCTPLPTMIDVANQQTTLEAKILSWMFPIALGCLISIYFLGETGVIAWLEKKKVI
jgi:hypothetical protein